MRSAWFAGLAVLAGCATSSAAPPVRGETPGRTCHPPSIALVAGAPASAAIGQRLLRESNAATLRWIAFGTMVTQDYRVDRLNVRLDPERRIIGADCG